MAEQAVKNQPKCTKKRRAKSAGDGKTNEKCAKRNSGSSSVHLATSEQDSDSEFEIKNKHPKVEETPKKAESQPTTKPTEQTCASCGLRMPPDATPDAQWCSNECEKHRIDDMDRRLESKIAELLKKRTWPSTICPSEVARALGGNDWRPLMEPVRRAARRMVARGEAEITQKGVVVDPNNVRGPIRIRRPPP